MVKIERRFVVKSRVQVQLIANFTRHVHLNVHVEQQTARRPRKSRQNRIGIVAVITAEGQIDLSLRANIDRWRVAKNHPDEVITQFFHVQFSRRRQFSVDTHAFQQHFQLAVLRVREIHFREWVHFFTVVFTVKSAEFLEIFPLLLLRFELHVLVKSHKSGRAVIVITNFFGNVITISGGVVFHAFFNGRRVAQIKRIDDRITEIIALAVAQRKGISGWICG